MSGSADRLLHLSRHLGDLVATVAGSSDTLRQDMNDTIVPARRASDGTVHSALAILDALGTQGVHGARDRLELDRDLGQGGMGVVKLARQVALGRDVAGKALRPDKTSPTTIIELLHEAWITGSLEHPNVVPVYDMALDEQGNPLIVFKRITGMTWAELIHDEGEVSRRFGAADLLEWNLNILLQVANAVRFAHSRLIVHRDLKPENVMIGEFGEVYVLDWGIAVSMQDDGTGRLPLARHATDMAGTPLYMAPEMLGGADPEISERTDIYLLGAILYEIVAGRPPHAGTTPLEIITSVAESRPAFPLGAPPGLVQICRRAMAPNPVDRYAGAEELRRAIRDFLHYRGSEQLALSAEERFSEMQQLMEATRAGTIDNRQILYNLYGACRFGFLEALSRWRDNQAAREGLWQATLTMIRYELAQNDPRAAAALLSDLSTVGEPPPELKARVRAALRAREDEQERIARLEQIDREFDLRIGSRTRLYVAVLAGLFLTLSPLVGALTSPISATYPGNLRMAVWTLGALIGLVLIVFLSRRSLLASTINRKLVLLFVCGLSVQAILHLGAEVGGFEPVAAQTLQMLFWASAMAIMAILINVRLVPAVLGYLLVFFVVALFPAYRFYGMTLANGVVALNVLVIWRPDRPPGDSGRSSFIGLYQQAPRGRGPEHGRNHGLNHRLIDGGPDTSDPGVGP